MLPRGCLEFSREIGMGSEQCRFKKKFEYFRSRWSGDRTPEPRLHLSRPMHLKSAGRTNGTLVTFCEADVLRA